MTPSSLDALKLPPGFDWQTWVKRWEAMQDGYLYRRPERFTVLVQTVRAALGEPARVLDLGCGPGSLMQRLLDEFPHAEVVGVDFDASLLALARARLDSYGHRPKFVPADLRLATWTERVATPFDAVVSATALHWLDENSLSALYRQIGSLLRPGGIFLNADHVASDYAPLQAAWDRERERWMASQPTPPSWSGFIRNYRAALGISAQEREDSPGTQRGPEQGLSLAWHFHALKAGGFAIVDCFWRGFGDAVYGGIRT